MGVVLTLTQFGHFQEVLEKGTVAACVGDPNTTCYNDELHYGPRLYARGMALEAQGQSSDEEFARLQKLASADDAPLVVTAAYLELSARRLYGKQKYKDAAAMMQTLTAFLDHQVYFEP